MSTGDVFPVETDPVNPSNPYDDEVVSPFGDEADATQPQNDSPGISRRSFVKGAIALVAAVPFARILPGSNNDLSGAVNEIPGAIGQVPTPVPPIPTTPTPPASALEVEPNEIEIGAELLPITVIELPPIDPYGGLATWNEQSYAGVVLRNFFPDLKLISEGAQFDAAIAFGDTVPNEVEVRQLSMLIGMQVEDVCYSSCVIEEFVGVETTKKYIVVIVRQVLQTLVERYGEWVTEGNIDASTVARAVIFLNPYYVAAHTPTPTATATPTATPTVTPTVSKTPKAPPSIIPTPGDNQQYNSFFPAVANNGDFE